MQWLKAWCVRLMWGVLISMTLSGCSDDDHHDVCLLTTELEPNDVISTPDSFVTQAEVFGEIFPGDCFTISGDLIDEADTDGYEFFISVDQTLVATLFHDPLIDLDLLIFNADTGELIQACSTNLEPESCSVPFVILDGGVNVDVVVISAAGSGSYTLQIDSF